MGKRNNDIYDAVSDESMARLAQIMNDSPSIVKLGSTEWKITALKPGTQWLISEEACKINSVEKATLGDIIKGLSLNMPSIVRILTLAILNDKRKIYDSNIYNRVYDTLLWGEGEKDWANLLLEVFNLIDVDFFFATTSAIEIFRQKTLARKMTMQEQQQLFRERNGEK